MEITPEAATVLRQLEAQHGSLFFHQSGCSCDGSAPAPRTRKGEPGLS